MITIVCPSKISTIRGSLSLDRRAEPLVRVTVIVDVSGRTRGFGSALWILLKARPIPSEKKFLVEL